ncbi:DnaB-like helicase C-terminal domain-containing protein [Oceanobacillus sojae]|uniref:DnaB-like helicase C-terminal domain-containing protein n=1 Tax=Oceanobacillus sojae TaxID=582851 RepID=UPI00098850CE|nr:DnaB-like helicase C-terminal domain-containing protein [Oceanobacillus sojae]
MANHGEQLLSRILDDGETLLARQYDLKESDFSTETERNVYSFIESYGQRYGGKAPDYRTVVEKFPDFYYREGVVDDFGYLAKEVKSQAAKRQVVEMFAGTPDASGKPTKQTVEQVINEKDGISAIETLISELEHIKIRTSVRSKVGTDIKKDAAKIKEEYLRRKRGESFRIYNSLFAFINNVVGGYTSSNLYVPYGKSGRGKSAITLAEAINLARQGANVLIWAMEMGWYELMVRIFTYYSRTVGDFATAEINGVNMDIGFDSAELRRGELSEDFEEKFFEFITKINELLPGNIIVRGVDDEDFDDRSLKALESDIIATEADIVVVDPFYYLDYERNTSKTTGGDAANTSKKLRRLAGKTQTVIFAITQADEEDEQKEDDGSRELKIPQRKDVKKTKQLLEDAYLLIGVDTDYKQGRGLIGLNKGRDGGEGEEAEIIYLPQYGIIEELSIQDAELLDAIEGF